MCTSAFKNYDEAWEYLDAKDRVELLELWSNWGIPDNFVFASAEDPEAESPVRQIMEVLITRMYDSEELLKMRDIMKGMKNPAPSEKAQGVVDNAIDVLVKQTLPSVRAFMSLAEPRYQAAMARSNEKAMPFPEDAIPLICEFAMPDTMLNSRMLGEDSDEEDEDSYDGYGSDDSTYDPEKHGTIEDIVREVMLEREYDLP